MSYLNRFSTPKPTTTTLLGSVSNDITVPNGPDDSISCVRWSPIANHLAVSSWDCNIRIYDHSTNVNGDARLMINFDKPVLTCDWSKDGTKVVGAGLDQQAKVQDLSGGGTAVQVAAHDAPIKSARFFDAPGSASLMLATASWDKTIRYWDLRQQSPVATVTCSERIYSMDIKGGLLVAATADQKMHIVDINQPTVVKAQDSKLKKQIRVVTCTPDGRAWGFGGVEGRAGVDHLLPKDVASNLTFRCHRDAQKQIPDVFTINDIQFHPVRTGVFSTAGSDGVFSFWNLPSRAKLQQFPTVGGAITSTSFNFDGSLFAYGVSYDWHKGFAHNTPQYPTKVMLHKILDDELKPSTARK